MNGPLIWKIKKFLKIKQKSEKSKKPRFKKSRKVLLGGQLGKFWVWLVY